ncbi:MAG TPA: hypothetical protein VGK55_07290 [Actinomycetes bacterium]
MRQEIHFGLRGMAPVSGGRTRWAWRRRIREAALAAHSSTVTSSSVTFEVRLVFHLAPWRLFRIDLDRLTTPVLDTLFASRDPLADRALTGVLFPSADDAAVTSLEAQKVAAADADHEGVDVVVIWHEAPGHRDGLA